MIEANNAKSGLHSFEFEEGSSSFYDQFGPESVIFINNTDKGIEGILVIDNTTLGPGNGGIIFSPAISPYEVFEHARALTLRYALMNINLGGAVAGVNADPSGIDKIDYLRSLAWDLQPHIPERFILAPNAEIGTEVIEAFVKEIGDRGAATGKPEKMGGIPAEFGIEGFGICIAITSAIEASRHFLGAPDVITDARIGILGAGNTGYIVAKCLANRGAKIVAVSDLQCTVYSQKGLDIPSISKPSFSRYNWESIKNIFNGHLLPPEAIYEQEYDILIIVEDEWGLPGEGVDSLKAKYVVEGKKDAVPEDIARMLHQNEVLVLPSILTLGGGAIGSFAEINGISVERAFSLTESRVAKVTRSIIQSSFETRKDIPTVAVELAKENLLRAMKRAKPKENQLGKHAHIARFGGIGQPWTRCGK